MYSFSKLCKLKDKTLPLLHSVTICKVKKYNILANRITNINYISTLLQTAKGWNQMYIHCVLDKTPSLAKVKLQDKLCGIW